MKVRQNTNSAVIGIQQEQFDYVRVHTTWQPGQIDSSCGLENSKSHRPVMMQTRRRLVAMVGATRIATYVGRRSLGNCNDLAGTTLILRIGLIDTASASSSMTKMDLQRLTSLATAPTQEWPDEALSALATEWRKKALEGDPQARGIAHELETELRRRAGAPFTNYDTLDMRPLEKRSAQLYWWRFWERR